MTPDKIKHAIRCAQEFIARGNAVLDAIEDPNHPDYVYKIKGGDEIASAVPRFTGALRRQSMEMTRSLAELRKSWVKR